MNLNKYSAKAGKENLCSCARQRFVYVTAKPKPMEDLTNWTPSEPTASTPPKSQSGERKEARQTSFPVNHSTKLQT